MHQILHIFRKDCRRFVPEIALRLALALAFIWLSPYEWLFQFGLNRTQHLLLDIGRLKTLSEIVIFVWPVSWLILIARVIQDENLLGNRQFWVTRPYIWQRLLAAKLLFIFTFVLIPFLAAQMILLVSVGFNPLHYLPGLLFLLVLITGAIVLPSLCLALVTSSLLRIIGTVLVIGVLVAAVAFVMPHNGYPSPQSADLPTSDRFTIPLIFAFSAAILLIQYSTRRLWLARGLLIALPLTAAAAGAIANNSHLLARYYPDLQPSEHPPIRITLDSLAGDNGGALNPEDQYFAMRVPLKTASIVPGHAVESNNIRITIDLPELHWTSTWQSTLTQHFDSNIADASLNVAIDRAVFERVQSKTVSLTIELALTELEEGNPIQTPYPLRDTFLLPAIGSCTDSSLGSRDYLNCLSPLHQPSISSVSARMCPVNDDNASPGATSLLVGSLDPDPADISMLPVWVQSLNFPSPLGGPRGVLYKICTGTPITITPFHLVRRFRYVFVTPNVLFPASQTDHVQRLLEDIH